MDYAPGSSNKKKEGGKRKRRRGGGGERTDRQTENHSKANHSDQEKIELAE